MTRNIWRWCVRIVVLGMAVCLESVCYGQSLCSVGGMHGGRSGQELEKELVGASV